MKSFEIYFKDLNENAKKNLLELLDIESEEEANFEIVPLAIIDFEEKEEFNIPIQKKGGSPS